MKIGQLIIGLIVGVIIGLAIGYFAVPPRTIAIASTTTTTVTQTTAMTQTVTSTTTATTTQTIATTTTVTTTQTVTAPPPTVLKPVYAASAVIDGAGGGVVYAPPLLVVVPPGTYVKMGNSTLSTYNLTVVLYPPPAQAPPDGSTPALTFAYFVNGYSGPNALFVDDKGNPKPVITIADVPRNWTSWAYAGYSYSGLAISGGRYLFQNKWIAASGWLVNLQFVRPIAWVFAVSKTPAPEPQTVEAINSKAPGFVPMSAATIRIANASGGAVALGNLLVVVQPGAYLEQNGTTTGNYNFSLVYYLALNVSGVGALRPMTAYAFAYNGLVTPALSLVDKYGRPMPAITVALWPPGTTSWTWIPATSAPYDATLVNGSYKFPDTWVKAGPYLVNLQFFKPVLWVFLAKTSGLSQSTTGGYSATSGYG